ncbi:hypothetical protein CU633_04705 [Bacillus sp. V3-13]|uniref:hypothetical protein n=1 Tax=unclassified Bacillus (in: firmicutes) TaxID=185979 RepID=UPI000C75BFAD|nr:MULTISPECIES: hypothetical protein [unclassified Bacillus (in: firmicutes)]PLR78533.1 hypothetical protein CU633_04705 [Bacillus sp. V3-13]PLR87145.1 hypothetical protein CVD23_03985 [Bacillus sp. V33-4]
MNNTVLLFLAGILAGFALLKVPAVSFLTGLLPLFNIIGALAIIVFSLALLYLGLRTLLSRNWG